MSLLSPDDIAYLRQQAGAKGMNADDLLKVINYESKGKPDVWGGKGGKYFGLIQFGGPERQQFGVDIVHPNARNQIDATFKYLDARGFRPGMGLLDLYSTVNAGFPGHYNASDRPGMTVAKHVAAMGGESIPSGAIPGSAPVAPSWAPAEAAGPPMPVGDPGEDVASEEPIMGQQQTPMMRGLLAGLLQSDEPQNSQLPQLPQIDMPSMPRGRGLAFKQLSIKTPKFSKRLTA